MRSVPFTRWVDLPGWLQRAAYMPPLQSTRYVVATAKPRAGLAPPLPRNKLKSTPLAGCRFLLFLYSLIAPDGELGAESLQHLHQHDQQRRGNKFQHHVEAVVAVVDGNLA